MLDIFLLIVLLICVVTDLRSRRILNCVTLPAVLIGGVYHLLQSGLSGLLFSGQGFLVGLGLLFIPFVLGGMGAGDVKFLAAIGSLKGTAFVFNTFIYAAIIGGIIAFMIMIKQRRWRGFMRRVVVSTAMLKQTDGEMQVMDNTELAPSFPYGVAIALGAVCTYVWSVIG